VSLKFNSFDITIIVISRLLNMTLTKPKKAIKKRPLSATPSIFFKMDASIKKARLLLDRRFTEAGIDLTADQWVLIERLYMNKSMPQTQLAEISAKDPATITRILDILCRKKLAVRVPSSSDRRSFEVQLTKDGKIVFKVAQKEAIRIRKESLDGLSDEEYTNFYYLMDKIYRQINQLTLTA
jgi:DNA-binding MarR family transcriptional regulator